MPEDWVRVSTRSTAPHTAPGQPVLTGMRLPQGYGYQWWLPAGDRGDFMGIGECIEFLAAIARSVS